MPKTNSKTKEELTHPDDAAHCNLTDYGNAERLVTKYGRIIRYCYERKRWLIWNGQHWEWDEGAGISFLAKATVRQIYKEAADEPDDNSRKLLVQHAIKSESDHRINAMINLAQSERRVPIRLSTLDDEPFLFNCENGTINLKTGELLKHRIDDFLTVLVPIEYDPDAKCDLWQAFLNTITDGNDDLQGYLQRAVGYSMTGDTSMQVLFFLYGLGNNGKSTFVSIIRKLMGLYGERVNTDTFMVKERGAGPKEALANMRSKRFVVASELEDGRRLSVSLIKDMTGGETIKADRKYEHEFEYKPTHKLWLVGNHKPIITDTTLAMWRRMKLIPFTHTIPERDIDPYFPQRLEEELPGILAWAVEGCKNWIKNSLGEPDVIRIATASYKHEQDILGDFLEDCCELSSVFTVPKSELKEEYVNWCQENSLEPITQRTFRTRMLERGISERRNGKARYWQGLRLVNADDLSDKTENNLSVNDKTCRVSQEFFSRKEIQENFMESVDTNVIAVTKDMPEYPTQPCSICKSSDFWLTEDNRWLCSRCHPPLKSK